MPDAAPIDTTVFGVSFALYTILIVGIGLYSARFARRSDEDYFLAGRSLGGWIAALSASASSESGWVTLGLVGLAYSSGVSAYWIIPGCLLGFLFNWFVVAGRMRDHSAQLGALTLPDFFAFHFKERYPFLRVLCVVVILVAMTLYVAAQLAAAGKAFSASFGGISDGFQQLAAAIFGCSVNDFQLGVLLGAAIVLVYTVIGGFRAVCWTDLLQALLMVGTLVVFPIYLLANKGGFAFISTQLHTVDPELLRFVPQKSGAALFGFLLGSGALGINFGYPGQPHVLIRFMALKDRHVARIGGVIAFCWGLLVYWGAVTVGLMARAITATGAAWGDKMVDGEMGLVISAMYMLPGVLAGCVLAAVLAAICSTADSQLVVAASSAANDLYARLFSRNEKSSHMIVNRLVVLVIGVAAVLLVFDSGQIDPDVDPDEVVKVYEYVLDYGWAILGAAFGPQLILLLLWKRASYVGCLLGMLAGFATAFWWKYSHNNQLALDVNGTEVLIEVYNLPLAFLVALVVNIVFSVIAPSGRSAAAHDG